MKRRRPPLPVLAQLAGAVLIVFAVALLVGVAWALLVAGFGVCLGGVLAEYDSERQVADRRAKIRRAA